MIRRRRRQILQAVEDNISRVPRGAQFEQPQSGPFPQAQAPAGVIQMPNCGTLPVVGNGMPMGLPRYTSEVYLGGRIRQDVQSFGHLRTADAQCAGAGRESPRHLPDEPDNFPGSFYPLCGTASGNVSSR